MFLDLMINGELKMTAEIDIENLTHGQRTRKLCKLLNVPFYTGKSTLRYNFFNEGKKFFDVIIPKELIPSDRLSDWSEGECVSIIDQKAICIGVINK